MENKREKNLKERGITLIALVVTIVVLLILAGVTIVIMFGENSIFDLAKTAQTKTLEEQAKEKVNLMIIGYKTKLAVNNSLTWDAYLSDEKTKDAYGISSITGNEEDGYTIVVNVSKQDYYIDIIIDENENAKIVSISNSNIKPTIDFEVNTEQYTFEEVEITVIATAPEGETITKIEPVEGNTATLKEGNTYIVAQSGTYSFKATTSGNKTNVASKTIKNILQIAEINATNVTETSLTINVLAQYPEESAVKYEYYVDGTKKCNKTLEKVYNATNLTSNITHDIKVIAYISDDNYKTIEKVVGQDIDFSNPINLSGKEIDESKIEYIYNNGVVNEAFGGVDVIENREGNSIAKFTTNYIFCSTSSRCSTSNAKIGTKNPIDLSKYESINAVINCSTYKEGNFGVGIFTLGDKVGTAYEYVVLKKVNSYSSFKSNQPCIISCDINQTGQGYAGVFYTYDRFCVSQIFLVKK